MFVGTSVVAPNGFALLVEKRKQQFGAPAAPPSIKDTQRMQTVSRHVDQNAITLLQMPVIERPDTQHVRNSQVVCDDDKLVNEQRKTTRYAEAVKPEQCRPASAKQISSRSQRRFRLTLDLTESLRICKSALSFFGFDFMQLGDRRLVCLKATSGTMTGKLCVEISLNQASNGATEVLLYDYSRWFDSSRSELLRAQLIRLQQVIEQTAA